MRYGATIALDRLDLTVGRDELFVLLGGSGSGKTTLLRAIAGFVRPDAGRIILDGNDLSGLPPHRRPVNTMFQSYALVPAYVGRGEHRLWAAAARHVPGGQRAGGWRPCWRWCGWKASAPAGRHELSGGQQQRVALARSLAPRPRLLLLDEPLSALDQALRRDTRAELVRLRRSLGISFVLVTHDQDEALEMADRIGVMRDGRMAQVGTPAELYEQPADRFVAEFLGAANILPCMVDGNIRRAAATGRRRASRAAGRRQARDCWRCGPSGCGSAGGLPNAAERHRDRECLCRRCSGGFGALGGWICAAGQAVACGRVGAARHRARNNGAGRLAARGLHVAAGMTIVGATHERPIACRCPLRLWVPALPIMLADAAAGRAAGNCRC